MLPKLDRPVVSITMPSTKKPVNFRPMTRREEKLLLQAKESTDPLAWVDAVRQLVTNCAVDPVDVDTLASFDLEYAFVRLRSASIGSRETISYRDADDEKLYDVEIDLEKVQVVFPEGADPMVDAGEGAKIQLRWPSAAAWADPAVTRAPDPESALDALISHCVERVYVGDQSYDATTAPREEVIEFLDSLSVDAWKGIRNWAGYVPHLSYWVEWKNSKGEQRRLELRTLTDFFTFSSQAGA